MELIENCIKSEKSAKQAELKAARKSPVDTRSPKFTVVLSLVCTCCFLITKRHAKVWQGKNTNTLFFPIKYRETNFLVEQRHFQKSLILYRTLFLFLSVTSTNEGSHSHCMLVTELLRCCLCSSTLLTGWQRQVQVIWGSSFLFKPR